MARKFVVWNAATSALTGAPASLATGTTIKTLMQLKPTAAINILEWGYSFDVVPAALVRVQLVVTGTVAGTVGTAYGAGDFAKFDSAQANASMDLAVSGFNDSAEGTITASRLLDGQTTLVQQYVKQFPWEREPRVTPADILRIRMLTATSINALCYIVFEE